MIHLRQGFGGRVRQFRDTTELDPGGEATSGTQGFGGQGEAFGVGAPLWMLYIGSVVAFYPVWQWYLVRLDDGSDEPFGLLPLLTALVLYGVGMGSLRRFLSERRSCGELLLPLAFAASYFIATAYGAPPLLKAICAVLTLGSLLAPPGPGCPSTGGKTAGSVGLWGLLLLSLPVIASLQFFLGYPARLICAFFAARLLALTGITPEVHGVLLEWQGKPLLIDAPCSGVKLLWMVSYLGLTLVTALRLTGRRAWLQLFAGSMLVLYANVLRTTFLFYTEMKLIAAPEWAHTAIGIVTAGGAAVTVLFLGSYHARKERTKKEYRSPHSSRYRWRAPASGTGAGSAYLAVLILALVVPADHEPRISQRDSRPIDAQSLKQIFPLGSLTLVPLGIEEERLAREFPGSVIRARLTGGEEPEQELLLRLVYRPTRALHPAGDCFRASGYAVTPEHAYRDGEGRVHSCFRAAHGAESLRVCERIESLGDRTSYPDVSTWFWNALLGRTEGPWVAVAVVDNGASVETGGSRQTGHDGPRRR